MFSLRKRANDFNSMRIRSWRSLRLQRSRRVAPKRASSGRSTLAIVRRRCSLTLCQPRSASSDSSTPMSLTLHDVPSLEQLHGLLERTLDVGILRKPEVRIPAGIEISEWYRAPLVVAIQQDHPLARRPSLSPSQLKGEPFVMYPREAGTGLYWQILDICAHAGFRPRIAREVLEPSTIIGLVAAGVGVAILPDGIQCIQFKGAIYKHLTDISAHSTLYLAHRQDDPNTHLRAICEMLTTSRLPPQRPRKPPASPARE